MFGLIRIIFIWASLCTQTRNLSPVDFALFVHIKKKERSLCLVVCLFTSYLSWFLQTSKNRQIKKTPKVFQNLFFVWCCEWSETILWNYSVVLIRENNSVEFSDVCFIFFLGFFFKEKMWRFHEVCWQLWKKKSWRLYSSC